MKLTFCGGVGEVTGSRHWLQAGGLSLLLDCGLVQGHRRQALEKNKSFLFKPADMDSVLLSHAHIDHCGALPLLAKAGYKGNILCTQATAELSRIMLLDCAHLQEADARFFNKVNAKKGLSIEPLYGTEDAERCLGRFAGRGYEEALALGPGVRARFLNAGHVLGSAMIEVEADGPKGRRRLLFTGDLGRRRSLLMDPPRPPENVDYLIIESTYGDRLHEPQERIEVQLEDILRRAVAAKGKVLIPSFALERTQELVFVLDRMRRKGLFPPIPVYVDSPMAASITELFDKHRNGFSFSPEFRAYVAEDSDPFGFDWIRYVRDTEESKGLNDLPGPMLIISASGMCEGGRILHHLRNNVGKKSTTVLIVGYQAEGTLGRRLLDGDKKVKIFGVEQDVRARVEAMHAFSAHADRADLLWFVESLKPRPRRVFLVHGDPRARAALAAGLREDGVHGVVVPESGDSFELL